MERGRERVLKYGNHDCICEWSNPEATKGGKAALADKLKLTLDCTVEIPCECSTKDFNVGSIELKPCIAVNTTPGGLRERTYETVPGG